MFSSKLFSYLRVLAKDEWKPLRQFLKGSKGENSDAFRLFNKIYDNRKKLSSPLLSADRVNLELFSHLSRKSFQNVMSVLKEQIEEFWIWKDLQENRVRRELHRLESLNKRGRFMESSKSLKALAQMTHPEKNLDLWNEYYFSRAQFELLFSNHPIKKNVEESTRLYNSFVFTFSSFSANLLLFFKAELQNMNMIRSKNWNEEIEYIDSLNLRPSSTKLRQSLEWQDELLKNEYEYLPEGILSLVENEDINISQILRLVYYYRIRRYYILRARTGDEKSIDELLDLIDWSNNSLVELYNNGRDINSFIGDLTIICALNQIEKAKLFLSKNLKQLKIEHREAAGYLGNMMISFTVGDYDSVIKNYIVSVFKIPSHRLHASGLFLRASYEVQGCDILYFDTFLRNTSDFIRRQTKSLSVMQVEAWKNFIILLRMLIKGASVSKLEEALQSKENVIHRNWLSLKIKERANF